MEQMPDEILENLFCNLNYRDLVNCTLVCSKWKEIGNRNSLWTRLCMMEKIYNKKNLDSIRALIPNPVKRYRQRDSSDCYWRKHFKAYKHLERNWRRVLYSLLQTNIMCSYYKDDMIISVSADNIEVYSRIGLLTGQRTCSRIEIMQPSLNIDTIFMQNGLIFYVQSSHITCMRQNQNVFEKVYDIIVENDICRHANIDNTPYDERLNVLSTEQFLVVLDNKQPCVLFFFNINTGENLREVLVQQNVCPKCTCLVEKQGKVYIGYSVQQAHFVSEYNIEEDKWTMVFDLSSPANDIKATKHFICVKMSPLESEYYCKIHTTNLHNSFTAQCLQPGNMVNLIPVSKHTPMVLTDMDILITHFEGDISVKDLWQLRPLTSFTVGGVIRSILTVGNDFLLINNKGILQLWDWKSGIKLQTLVYDVTSIWADDLAVIFNQASDNNCSVMTFW